MDFGDIIYIVILVGGLLFSFIGKAMKKSSDTDAIPAQPYMDEPEIAIPLPMDGQRRRAKIRKQQPPVPPSTHGNGMAQIEVQDQPYSEISATEIGSEKEEVDNSFTLSDEEIRKGIIISELLERKF